MPEARLCTRCHNPLPEGRRTRMHSECVRAYRAELDARPAEAVRHRAGSATTSIPSRRFGVEIEFYSSSSFDAIEAAIAAAGVEIVNTHRTHNGSNPTAWTLKYDGSLSGSGKELVSPPLAGAEGFEQLRTVCRVLRSLGAHVNRSCGLHIHHDVEDLNLRQFKNVVIGYHNHQRSIDQLVSESRRGRQNYCGPETNIAGIRNCPSLGSIAQQATNRYVNVNLQAFPKYGTLEFRQHQGSVNFAKIAAWISFGQALVAKAKADAEAGTLYEIAAYNYVARTAELLAELPLPAARRRQLLSRIGQTDTEAAA